VELVARLFRTDLVAAVTFGTLRFKGHSFATIEPPWDNNKRNTSRIPGGTYSCKVKNSARFGMTFEIKNVPQRSDILFHKGNTSADTRGCICIGLEARPKEKPPTITKSSLAFQLFLALLENTESFELRIFDPPKTVVKL